MKADHSNHPTSQDVAASITKLEALIAKEQSVLASLETTEGTDYLELLSTGAADTGVVEQIAKANARITVLNRGLVAAKADLAVALDRELLQRRLAAKAQIVEKFEKGRDLIAEVERLADEMSEYLVELTQIQRTASHEMLELKKQLGVPTEGVHVMEARKSMETSAVLGQQLQVAIFKKSGLMQPDHIPYGHARPLSEQVGQTFDQATREIDVILGLDAT